MSGCGPRDSKSPIADATSAEARLLAAQLLNDRFAFILAAFRSSKPASRRYGTGESGLFAHLHAVHFFGLLRVFLVQVEAGQVGVGRKLMRIDLDCLLEVLFASVVLLLKDVNRAAVHVGVGDLWA